MLAVLVHPDCPWEPAARRSPVRRVKVDRLLAFAFSRGLALRGLEERCDAVVARAGGRRDDAGRGLPHYELPKLPG